MSLTPGRNKMGTGSKISLGIFGVIILAAVILGSKVVETVEKGTYHIKQAAISGKMTAIMDPEIWQENSIIVVKGKLNDRDGVLKLLCDEVKSVASLV